MGARSIAGGGGAGNNEMRTDRLAGRQAGCFNSEGLLPCHATPRHTIRLPSLPGLPSP
jgi:hypothetical protein